MVLYSPVLQAVVYPVALECRYCDPLNAPQVAMPVDEVDLAEFKRKVLALASIVLNVQSGLL